MDNSGMSQTELTILLNILSERNEVYRKEQDLISDAVNRLGSVIIAPRNAAPKVDAPEPPKETELNRLDSLLEEMGQLNESLAELRSNLCRMV